MPITWPRSFPPLRYIEEVKDRKPRIRLGALSPKYIRCRFMPRPETDQVLQRTIKGKDFIIPNTSERMSIHNSAEREREYEGNQEVKVCIMQVSISNNAYQYCIHIRIFQG